MTSRILRAAMALIATTPLLLIGGASTAQAEGPSWVLCIKTAYGNSQPGTNIRVVDGGTVLSNSLWDYGDGVLTSCWWDKRVYSGHTLSWQLHNPSTGWYKSDTFTVSYQVHLAGAVYNAWI